MPNQNPPQDPGEQKFLRGIKNIDAIPAWERDQVLKKQAAQSNMQDALRQQMAQKESEKAQRDAKKREEDEKEQLRIQKEQDMLRYKYAKEMEDQRLRDEEARIENEKKAAEKMARLKMEQEQEQKRLHAEKVSDQAARQVVTQGNLRILMGFTGIESRGRPSPPLPTLAKQQQPTSKSPPVPTVLKRIRSGSGSRQAAPPPAQSQQTHLYRQPTQSIPAYQGNVYEPSSDTRAVLDQLAAIQRVTCLLRSNI